MPIKSGRSVLLTVGRLSLLVAAFSVLFSTYYKIDHDLQYDIPFYRWLFSISFVGFMVPDTIAAVINSKYPLRYRLFPPVIPVRIPFQRTALAVTGKIYSIISHLFLFLLAIATTMYGTTHMMRVYSYGDVGGGVFYAITAVGGILRIDSCSDSRSDTI